MKTRSRSTWGALALVAPVAAASLVGSVVWMSDHDPRAAASTVQQSEPVDPALQDMADRVAALQARADKVRGEAQGLTVQDAGKGTSGNATAPEPVPQPDTWTGASGG